MKVTTDLNAPKVNNAHQRHVEPEGLDDQLTITLRNDGSSIAYFVTLTLLQSKDGPEVLPVEWSDNDVTLAPFEERTLTVTYRHEEGRVDRPFVDVCGWNATRLAD
ncbi:MAG: hypothetical protein NVSMB1_19320 [Polyangiales bacterium]